MASSFRQALQDKVIDTIKDELGSSIKDVFKFVPTGEVPVDQFPCMIVIMRSKDYQAGEIGQARNIIYYRFAIYYLDVTDDDFDGAEARRDSVLHQIEKRFEIDFNLGGFSYQADVDEVPETVYDSNVDNVLFDASGQLDAYTFTAEIDYTVYTSKI